MKEELREVKEARQKAKKRLVDARQSRLMEAVKRRKMQGMDCGVFCSYVPAVGA